MIMHGEEQGGRGVGAISTAGDSSCCCNCGCYRARGVTECCTSDSSCLVCVTGTEDAAVAGTKDASVACMLQAPDNDTAITGNATCVV